MSPIPADTVALRFQVGARTLASVPRRLHRVALSLDDVLAGALPPLPPLGERDGHLVTSLPAALPPVALSSTSTPANAGVHWQATRVWTPAFARVEVEVAHVPTIDVGSASASATAATGPT